MNQNHDSITLLEERANPIAVESLYRQGLLSQGGREMGLSFLNPHENWGYWISTLLLILGWVFILSGITYFFAFNWHKMSSYYKFSSIQVLILVCLAGAWAYEIDNLRGKLFLTGGCILIGVFLAVFGQVYQTGADSFLLFLIWTLIITPLVFISRFAPLWAVWLLLFNMTAILYWNQDFLPSKDTSYYLYIILLCLNGIALISREWFYNRQVQWLQGRWHRIGLCLALLIISFIPMTLFIMDKHFDNPSLFISALAGYCLQMGFLYHYRYYVRDRWVFALTLLSLSLIACEIGYQILDKFVKTDVLNYLFMTIIVLVIFSSSAYILRRLSQKSVILQGGQ
jgi:uncharacterized membrane protein